MNKIFLFGVGFGVEFETLHLWAKKPENAIFSVM
jgi:hypothetical protein